MTKAILFAIGLAMLADSGQAAELSNTGYGSRGAPGGVQRLNKDYYLHQRLYGQDQDQSRGKSGQPMELGVPDGNSAAGAERPVYPVPAPLNVSNPLRDI